MALKADKKKKKRQKISYIATLGIGHDRDYFIENLSLLVASGMGVMQALDATVKDIRTKSMKNIIALIRDDIEAGSPMWKALSMVRVFDAHTVSLIKIGEESGRLAENLKVVSLQQEKEREFKSKIRSAMMYPIFVLGLTLFVGIGIAWFILPKLALVFSQLNLDLPFITRVLIGTGLFLSDYGVIVVPLGLLALAALVFFIFFFPKTKFVGQTFLFFIPGIKRLIMEVELARFGYLLGILLEAGLPIVQALDSLAKASYFPHYRKFYNYLKTSIEEGNSFQKSFENYEKLNKIMPTPIQQLVIVGEQSGNLSKTLLKISESYNAKTEITTKNLTVILEPILLVIVWMGVVGVALAVILPIYSLVGGLNAGDQVNTTPVPPAQTAPATPKPAESNQLNSATTTSPVTEIEITTLKILESEAGFVNVRSSASVNGEIIGTVNAGEEYEYTFMENGWYEIVLNNGQIGWISEDFAEITSDQITE